MTFLQALEEEKDDEEETAEFIPIDSVDMQGEEEVGSETEQASPVVSTVSPKRTALQKKTSITPVLSKNQPVLYFCVYFHLMWWRWLESKPLPLFRYLNETFRFVFSEKKTEMTAAVVETEGQASYYF